MRGLIELSTHILFTLLKLCKPGGVTQTTTDYAKPQTTTQDCWFFGIVVGCITHSRLHKIAIAIKPATLLKFHKALVKRKYKLLYSNKNCKKPGRSGPPQKIIDIVVEMKQRNQSFGMTISYFAVGRILRKYHSSKPGGGNEGPSWPTFIGNITDGLWSVDFFKCESITMKTHTVMAIIDQFSRQIIGFAIHIGDPNGIDICCMFNSNFIDGGRTFASWRLKKLNLFPTPQNLIHL